MKSKHIIVLMAMALPTLGLQSCLDYDNPGDEFNSTTKNVEKVTSRGDVDKIPFRQATDAAAADEALNAMQDLLDAGVGGQFSMRGGKNGENPGAHAYQYQYSLGVDNYAEYTVVPHTFFQYSKIRLASSYAIDQKCYGGAWGSFTEMKTSLVPILNNEKVNAVPELKAAYLTLFNQQAVEVADVYGPMPYRELKTNLQVGPYTYNKVEDVYNDAVANLDTAIACFHYFDQKPAACKQKIKSAFVDRFVVMTDGGAADGTLKAWARYANSLKLRIAMHMVKSDPVRAQKLAEEAVADGVIENEAQSVSIRPGVMGFSHPLPGVESWGDARMSATMEITLKTFNHPWLKYLFKKNDNVIKNNKTGETTPADSRICGIRTGTHPGEGQGYDENQYIAFSKLNEQYFNSAPLYLMKYAEVCFLRAEGALRGWNMGGSAQHFYEEGIRHGNCEDPEMKSMDGESPNGQQNVNWYDSWIDTYMAQENPVAYVYKDPTGDTPDAASPIHVGVKWNDSDSQETKLEKIITQKYLATYPNGFEAWVDLRRTGFPRMLPVLNIDEADGSLVPGDIMRRLPFPGTSDIATKQDVDNTGIPALGGPDKMATRLFWDKTTSNF